jgi:PIN domain nuclease of toxin-antitoxin system
LAVKIGTGKLVFEGGIELFFQTVRESGFVLLPIRRKHIKTLETLPFLHRDPFDRILIASAMIENMGLITADTNIRLYDVASLW